MLWAGYELALKYDDDLHVLLCHTVSVNCDVKESIMNLNPVESVSASLSLTKFNSKSFTCT